MDYVSRVRLGKSYWVVTPGVGMLERLAKPLGEFVSTYSTCHIQYFFLAPRSVPFPYIRIFCCFHEQGLGTKFMLEFHRSYNHIYLIELDFFDL